MKRDYLILKMALGFLFFNIPFLYAQTADELVHLGNVAGRQEKYNEAIVDYTKAIKIDPHDKKAYYNRGYVYIEKRRYKQAIADLDMAIYIDIKYTAAYHLRGVAYFQKKKYSLAIFNYSKALEFEPKNIKYHISRLSAYFKMGDNDHAWEEVQTIQKLGGTVNPSIINLLKNKKYRDQ